MLPLAKIRAAHSALPFEHWSWSKISTWLRCPRRFRYEYIDLAPRAEVSAALLLGSAVHGAICLFHARGLQGGSLPVEAVEQQVEDLLRSSVAGSDVPVSWSRTEPDLPSSVALGRSLVRTYVQAPRAGTVLAVEKELLTALPGTSLPLVGILDRIDRDPDGVVTVVELKTAARAWSTDDVALNGQATAYCALLDSLRRPVRVRFEVLTKTKEPRLQVLETLRTRADVARLTDLVVQVERAVVAGAYPRHASSTNCGTCPYRHTCLS